ncbi:MAG TPA: hypothetical protein VGB38_04240 [bacterium]
MTGQSKPIIVIRKSATEVIALSSACTHQENEVNLPQAGSINCRSMVRCSTFPEIGLAALLRRVPS